MNSEHGSIKPLTAWSGEMGNAWLERHKDDDGRIDSLMALWREIAAYMSDEPKSVLEIGPGKGDHLEALQALWPQLSKPHALNFVEPNGNARRHCMERFENALGYMGHAGSIPLGDSTMDLVFTSGVLIHVPADDLPDVYREIHRVAKRWIVSIEYFSQKPQEIEWRGKKGMLWKRDFGTLWCHMFPQMVPIQCGFAWKKLTGLDDPTWWLFRK